MSSGKHVQVMYTLEPHFYIAKLGYAGVNIFFLFLLQNIDCGYSLNFRNFKNIAWACFRNVWDLIRNPNDQFSTDKTHISITVQFDRHNKNKSG